jgi:hypothetical protein
MTSSPSSSRSSSRRVWLWVIVAAVLVVLAAFALQPIVGEFLRGFADGVADRAAGRPPRT